MSQAVITLKPIGSSPAAGLIPTEIFSRFADTAGQDREITIPLPATPGLAQIKEVVITFGPESQGRPIDLSISCLKVWHGSKRAACWVISLARRPGDLSGRSR